MLVQWYLIFAILSAGPCRGGSPEEAMEEFIAGQCRVYCALYIIYVLISFTTECNDFVEMMDHCAEGWVAFEEEIILSVDSFVDRIVYTESLILEEANEIVEMADRIVYTEELMFGLIESCGCNEGPTAVRTNTSHQHQHQHHSVGQPPQVATDGAFGAVPSDNTRAVTMDTCSAMDMALEVMDACMATFETFNDDFLEVLSYLDYAIQDMGDRIVDTECMIMNMSLQIGLMADEIVEVEELTVNMLESCCRNNKDTRVYPQPAGKPDKYAAGNDDLLSHCDEFNGDRRSAQRRVYISKTGLVVFDGAKNDVLGHKDAVAHASTLLNQAIEKARKGLSTATISKLLARNLGSKDDKVRQISPNETLDDDNGGVMPCDTWWNPFCCAAEMCADMMAEMVTMMAQGMDGMTDLCKNCIDEVGQIADAIVDTEEDILVMGYAINDMADCIVLFIDQGLDFMSEFCPTSGESTFRSRKNPYMRGAGPEPSQKTLQGETCSETSRVKQLQLRLAYRSIASSSKMREVVNVQYPNLFF